ncbi:hypothetical protein [Actinoplanes sp. URMC 104]|uniref:hypothetical protein n=1 Tax=Actinoplanes sp. URMC 104 TaxID=3423409 RepID=UPI003F1D2871
MSDHRVRVDEARAVAQQLSELLLAEGRGAYVWQQRMRQIAADLSVTDAGDAEMLQAARDRFRSLYAGGRNFSDYYIHRDDEAERIAVNDRLEHLVDRLRTLLTGD